MPENSTLGSRQRGHAPLYVVLGHVAKDLTPDGPRPGGTALYSALAAQRLGMQAAVVTSFAEEDAWLVDDLLSEGVSVQVGYSPLTTTFTNSYDSAGVRKQALGGSASIISLGDVPLNWLEGPAVLHLGPIAQEIPQDLSSHATSGVLGITPQGWLRAWDGNGNVSHQPWPIPPALTHLPTNSIVVMSQEDLDFDQSLIEEYSKAIPHFVVTNGVNPAHVFISGIRSEVPTYPAQVIDPTGAGDVFAAALFVRYSETYDLLSAARFAHAAAALSINAPGTAAIPTRDAVLAYSASAPPLIPNP